jgi:hypothetical protein
VKKATQRAYWTLFALTPVFFALGHVVMMGKRW